MVVETGIEVRLMWSAGSWDLATLVDRVRYTMHFAVLLILCSWLNVWVGGKTFFSSCTGASNLNGLNRAAIIPVNQSVVPVHLSNLMCVGVESNLLENSCVFGLQKRQTEGQTCNQDAAVTCVGMFLYKDVYVCLQGNAWVSLFSERSIYLDSVMCVLACVQHLACNLYLYN